jgi:hypothetical protein
LFQRSSDCEGGAVAVASLGWSDVASVITNTVTRLTLGFAENWRSLPRSRRHTRVQRWPFVWCARRRGAAGRPDGNTLSPVVSWANSFASPDHTPVFIQCSAGLAEQPGVELAAAHQRRVAVAQNRGHVLEAVPVGEQHPWVEPLVTSGDKKLPLAFIDPPASGR